MTSNELIPRTKPGCRVRIIVTTVEVEAQAARDSSAAHDRREPVLTSATREAHTRQRTERPSPEPGALRHWSPMQAFVPVRAGYQMTWRMLGTGGKLSIVYISLSAGVVAVLWRQYTVPIGAVGGLLVAAIMCVRTGAYREYLAAIEDAHGIPPIGAVLRYNLGYLGHWVRALWRQH